MVNKRRIKRDCVTFKRIREWISSTHLRLRWPRPWKIDPIHGRVEIIKGDRSQPPLLTGWMAEIYSRILLNRYHSRMDLFLYIYREREREREEGSNENMCNLKEQENQQNHMWFTCDDVTAHAGAGIPARVFTCKSHVIYLVLLFL